MTERKCERASCGATFCTIIEGQTKCPTCRPAISYVGYSQVERHSAANGCCIGCGEKLEADEKHVCEICSKLTVKMHSRTLLDFQVYYDLHFEVKYLCTKTSQDCGIERHKSDKPSVISVSFPVLRIFHEKDFASVWGSCHYTGSTVYFELEDKMESCGKCKTSFTLVDVLLVDSKLPTAKVPH